MTKRPSLFTIGYEQATSPAFLGDLKEAGVELLVDVRAVAASRRPGFSKRQLAAALDEENIAYLHLRALGTPKEGRLAARAGRAVEMLRIYETHLATPQAKEELDELCALAAGQQRICLMCYERDIDHCHRKRIAEIVSERTGAKVTNLVPPLF